MGQMSDQIPVKVPVTVIEWWLGGAMVLGKLPVPGLPSNLADSRARAYCACSGWGWGCFYIFTLIYLFSPLSPSLWEMARYRLKYCLKGPLNPKQPTNHYNWPVIDPYQTASDEDQNCFSFLKCCKEKSI